MIEFLRTYGGRKAFEEKLKPIVKSALLPLYKLNSPACRSSIEKLNASLDDIDGYIHEGEAYLNDLFVLHKYNAFISSYVDLWQNIIGGDFSKSWSDLQDCLDMLCLIKRFSDINVEFFENQLLSLEELYPYRVLFSIGVVVEKFECSICSLDIDSLECQHVKDELYNGEIAYGTAKNVISLDHASIVSNPQDKRCVVQYDDSSEHFKLVYFLAQTISNNKFSILDFYDLQRHKLVKRNPSWQQRGRNEPCFCGSGKKFKVCCISKQDTEIDHIELIAKPWAMEQVIV